MTYLEKKEELKKQAIEMKNYIVDEELAWWDYQDAVDDFVKIARKYGLIKELKKIGLIK